MWPLSLHAFQLYPDCTLYLTVNMSSDADFVALHPKQPPEPTTYPMYPTYPVTGSYQLTGGGLAAPTVSSGNINEEKKEEEKAEEEYEPGSIPVEHLNVSVCGPHGAIARSSKLQ